jgi:hypothetical protein
LNGFYHGKTAVFKIDGSSGVLTDISTGMADCSLPQSVDTVEGTGFTDTAKQYVMGLQGANGTISGTLTTTVDPILAGIVGSTDTKSFEFYPYSTASGSIYKKGECIPTAYETKQSVSGLWSYTFSFIVSGGITSSSVA